MKTILVIGASGKSSSYLVRYFIEHQAQENWNLILTDLNVSPLLHRFKATETCQILSLDIQNNEQRQAFIQKADIVVSMVPAFMHMTVARECVEFKKHLVTASYVSEDMQKLHEQALKNGVVLMNEMGLDPGIDHMSAMQIMDEIRAQGSYITSFKSYCGGLVAPESDTNPWNYKFSWNPRNVVLAGAGGSVKYLEEGEYKYIPYHHLFSHIEKLEIEGYGAFDGYANRDSLKYIKSYGLDGIQTMFRGTLRRHGFCTAWNVFVQLGMTDDSFIIPDTKNMTRSAFLSCFIPGHGQDLRQRLKLYLSLSDTILQKLDWLGFFSDEPIELNSGTSAQILQHILEKKWVLDNSDKDMVVMLHQIEYEQGKIQSSLVVLGEDATYTAMAKTVGLPMAIFTKLLAQEKITLKGVQIPTMKEVYEPVLNELYQYGIQFQEQG